MPARTCSRGRRGTASRARSTRPGTRSSACPRRRAASSRRSSSSSPTWTWSASATRPARTTRARGGSRSSSTATGCVADGTTLGADNGIGVAAALAVAEDAEVDSRPARAALHRQRGGGARGREGARARARLRPAAREPRRHERHVDHDRLRRERAHVRAARARPGARPRGWSDARRGDLRRARRPLRADIAKGRANAIKALGRVLAASRRPCGSRRSTGA